MSIDGKHIADDLLHELTKQTAFLKSKGVTPTMGVILVGDDPGSASYVRQKEKAAERIGAQLRVMNYESRVTRKTIQQIINQWNDDPSIHGIIIQRPLPRELQDPTFLNSIIPEKDIDGFVPDTKFSVPVALAVGKILENIYNHISCHPERSEGSPTNSSHVFLIPQGGISIPGMKGVPIPGMMHASDQTNNTAHLNQWIQQQRIVVIGRGETAGKPIADHLRKRGCNVSVIHSRTTEEEKQNMIKDADIIISCVGKERVITSEGIKKGVILISVGIWRDNEGKLHGDYEEEEIKYIASFYTPTPGGVGPVNVACLMANLCIASTKSREA